MQPPSRIQELHYDQNMTAFPPRPASGDVFSESPRERNIMPSIPRSTIPAPSLGFGVSGNPESYAGDSRVREHQCTVPVSSSRESFTLGLQNDSVTPTHPNERGSHESFSDCNVYSSVTGKPAVGTSGSSHEVCGKVGQSQTLPQNMWRLEGHVVGLDNKGGDESCIQSETSSSKQSIDFSSLSGVDFGNMLGIKIGNSVLSVPETNNLIKNALRLLGAPLGSSSTVNHDGGSAPNSHSQSLGQNPDTRDKGSENVVDKQNPGNGDSALIEKLWDGTLKLSTSVSVPAFALFKSGEHMQDLSWSGLVEVQGKVKLDAFEKYVQNLPRARTRGLMVVSLCWKEGCSADDRKGMSEVARQYKERKRVGVAPLSKGVDLYICPRSDAIITILAKHGYFKGKDAVDEKSGPLIGCVVWRRGSLSAPATKTTEVKAPSSGPSLDISSNSSSNEVPCDHSDKIQTETGGTENISGKKSPVAGVPSHIHQPKPSMTLQNIMASVGDFKTSMEPFKLPSPVTCVRPTQSAESPDDEDLPEFDFGAGLSQRSDKKTSLIAPGCSKPEMEFRSPQVHPLTSAQMRPESSTVPGAVPDLQVQGLLTQNMNHNPASNHMNIQALQEYQRSGYTSNNPMPSAHGLASQNMGHGPRIMSSSLTVEKHKLPDLCPATSKPRSRFDVDDDMPEWCPPVKRTRQEIRTGPSFAVNNALINGSGFTDLVKGRQLPLPPLPPAPHPPSFTPVQNLNLKHPTEQKLPPPPPPPLLPPPPSLQLPPRTQAQFPGQNYPSVAYLPQPAANTFVNDGSPAPPAHVQLQVTPNSHAGHQPSLPPLPQSARPVTLVNVSNKDYTSAPHFPRPAENSFMHDTLAPSNFMYDRPAAPTTPGQFQDKHYPADPYCLPPPIPDERTANNFLRVNCANASSQMQFRNHGMPSIPRADHPTGDRSGDQMCALPPGFAPDPGSRSRFHQHGKDNQTHHSAWMSSNRSQ